LVKNYINIRDRQNNSIIEDEILKPILCQYLGEISDESLKIIQRILVIEFKRIAKYIVEHNLERLPSVHLDYCLKAYFKNRIYTSNAIKSKKIRIQSRDPEVVDDYFKNLKKVYEACGSEYKHFSSVIFNCDESGFPMDPLKHTTSLKTQHYDQTWKNET